MKNIYYFISLTGNDGDLFSITRDIVLNRRFSEKDGLGFTISEHSDSSIEASYHERKSFTEKFHDPLGVEHSYERTVFERTDFSIRSDSNIMVINNPPLSYRRLLKQINDRLHGGQSVQRLDFGSLVRVVELLRKIMPAGKITYAATAGMLIKGRVNMTCAFAGIIDVEKDAREFLAGKRFGWSRVRCVEHSKEGDTVVDVTKAGRVAVSYHRVGADKVHAFIDHICRDAPFLGAGLEESDY